MNLEPHERFFVALDTRDDERALALIASVRADAIREWGAGSLRARQALFTEANLRLNAGLVLLSLHKPLDIAEQPLDHADALQLVGLDQRSNHYPAQMSGGEQQRVAIARAIVKRPDVLLCDEPTGALDVKTGILVLEALERINRELGTLTAVITHNATIASMAPGDSFVGRPDCEDRS